ncbi:hypothetical protein GCM10023187_10480 [Nibrella viscosa]|uniref:Uncharacterized protein n=1 Tax=Nibrella viscosa TaxID=1084524 RepID=A0ABP8K120_9BACT
MLQVRYHHLAHGIVVGRQHQIRRPAFQRFRHSAGVHLHLFGMAPGIHKHHLKVHTPGMCQRLPAITESLEP